MPGRKPTNVLKMSGAFKVNPGRYKDRENEPEPDPELGDAPESLSDEEKAQWERFKRNGAPGVLTKQDRQYVETACRLAVACMGETKPTAALWGLYLRSLSGLGFSPSDRSRVSVKKRK